MLGWNGNVHDSVKARVLVLWRLAVIVTAAPGQMRERVGFERRGVVDDGFGNPVSGEFAQVFSCWGRIKPARGGESIQAARLAGRQPVVITVRSSTQSRTVTTEWRARGISTDTVYQIRSIVNPDEKAAYLDMECEAGVAT